MTGGQKAIGGATPWAISKQLAAEGVKKIYVVSDEPEQFKETKLFADKVGIFHRDELINIQKEVREISGVTAIIYVQTCATELRRRRKRGYVQDRDIKMYINPDVCEGCGDCAEKSNCVAVKPIEHFDGTKRQIDQSVCNKDYSCKKGLPNEKECPDEEYRCLHEGKCLNNFGFKQTNIEILSHTPIIQYVKDDIVISGPESYTYLTWRNKNFLLLGDTHTDLRAVSYTHLTLPTKRIV